MSSVEFVIKYWWLVAGLIIFMEVMFKRIASTKNDKTKQSEYLVANKFDDIKEFNEEGKSIMSTTDIGYINKNNQRNNGRTDIPGTDFGQWFYDMECLNCGHRYHANGSNIYEKKCPNCQTQNTTKSKRVAKGQKSTDAGYINRNQQENLGKTTEPGTDFGQWFYQMKCLHCGP